MPFHLVPVGKAKANRSGGQPVCPRAGVTADSEDAVSAALVSAPGDKKQVFALLACPACGGKGNIITRSNDTAPVVCRDCGAAGAAEEFLHGVVAEDEQPTMAQLTAQKGRYTP